jgi:hypothetical protein
MAFGRNITAHMNNDHMVSTITMAEDYNIHGLAGDNYVQEAIVTLVD